jgi:CRP-like cAMP-binding protein
VKKLSPGGRTAPQEKMFVEQLKNVPLFSSLRRDQLRLIRHECREANVRGGSAILLQDEGSQDLYVILEGRVKISLMNDEARTVTLALLGKGDFFGELSLFDRKPRSAFVSAVTDTRLLVLTRESILSLIRKNPDIAVNFLSEAAARLRKADDKIMTLTFLDVCGRVANALLELAEAAGRKPDGGPVRIPMPTHRSLAEQIGASRESVTKALKSLILNGQVRVEDRSLIIDPKQFEIL